MSRQCENHVKIRMSSLVGSYLGVDWLLLPWLRMILADPTMGKGMVKGRLACTQTRRGAGTWSLPGREHGLLERQVG